MKKIMFIVGLILAMLIVSSCAFAADMPQIILARDSNGNDVSEIYIEGQSTLTETPDGVVITPISEKDNAPTSEIKDGLDQIQKDQQTKSLGELTGETDDDVLDDAIDDYLYEINHPELDADSFETVDSFSAVGSGSYADYLDGSGKYLEVTYHKTTVTEDNMLLVTYSPDGKHWSVVQPDYIRRNADGTVTVRMDNPGYFSFNVNRQGGGTSTQVTPEVTEETPAPSVTEAPPEETEVPSPEQQGTTEVIGAVDSKGRTVVTYKISNLDFVPTEDDRIIITPVEFRENAPTEKIETDLDNAFTINEVIYSAAELEDENGNSIKDAMDQRLAEMGRSDLTAEDMVVLDVFHVLGSTRYQAFLEVEGNYIDVTYLAMGLEPNQTLVVLYGTDGIHWTIYPEEYITRNADGSVTVRMYDFGHFSFVVESTAEE